MNNHIELVKKWLKDKSSVTVDELKANADAAYAAYAAADAAAALAARAAYYAARAASDAVESADYAEFYIESYEEIKGE
jgi:hypothetical protein